MLMLQRIISNFKLSDNTCFNGKLFTVSDPVRGNIVIIITNAEDAAKSINIPLKAPEKYSFVFFTFYKFTSPKLLIKKIPELS